MIRLRTLEWAVTLVMAGACILAPAAGASEPLPPAISDAGAIPGVRPSNTGAPRLLRSIDSGVTFEVAVPWEQLRADLSDSTDYVQVSFPGWSGTSRAGAPMLPMMAQAIGVPHGAELSVQVEAGPAHTVALPAPALPVATQKVEWEPQAASKGAPALPQPSLAIEEDPAVYAGEAAYPGALAEVASDGVVRQQRVAGIVAYPVQYHPATRELTIYEWLKVTVTFEGATTTLGEQPSVDSPAYENMLRGELLNYETARAWRQALTPSTALRAEAEPSARVQGAPWAPPVPGWRIKVREDGFYRLSFAELSAAGVPVIPDGDSQRLNLDPHTLQLHNLGNEVAIQVVGEEDGHFDEGDALIFYGQPVSSKYTRDNVYWLTYGGAAGARMAWRDGAPGAADTPASYRARRRLESNTFYFTNAPGDDDLDRFMWDYIYSPSIPSWTHTFSLAAPHSGDGTATLTVAMVGYLQSSINPDHHAQVYLNNTLLGDVRWDGITWQVATFDVAQSLLAAGDNTLKVSAPNDTGVGSDVIYIDWAELEYDDNFVASGNVLPFTAVAGTWKYGVTGFTANQLAVYDVTTPAAVARIENISVTGSGPYAAVFQDTLAAAGRYWTTATSAYRTVQAIEADTPSTLQSTANGADYVVITHPDFAAQAADLRNFRASQGLDAVLVDVQDVYDEFGYGIVGAAPIHDFLAYAYGNWRTKPSYVVLMGDGHYDPKDYFEYGRVSYMPPYLAEADPWLGETAADNRYVTLVGNDAFPDMMLGRLAVNSSAEATAMVSKIISYEQSPVPGAWQQQVLAVADDADSAGNFAQASDNLLTCCLPQPYQAQKVHYLVTHSTLSLARAAIQTAINDGKLIVNYIGHGSADQWADESLLDVEDVPLLKNGGKLPVMLPMTCYDGYYHYPFTEDLGYDAMAEVLTRADGRGAVASWSPTGLGVSSGHDYLDRGFFNAVFQDGLHELGEATNAGKLALWATGANLDLVDTYLLFGDPATAMPVAGVQSSADVQVTMAMNPAGSVAPGAALEYTITFSNNGPSTATGVVLSDPLPAGLSSASWKVVGASSGVTLRAGTTFVWDIPSLASGANGWVKVSGAVNPALAPPATIVNTAEIDAAQADPNSGNNTASVSTVLPASVLLPVMHVGGLP